MIKTKPVKQSGKKRDKTKRKSTISLLVFIFKLIYQQNRWLLIGMIGFGVLAYFVPRLEAYIGGKLIDEAVELVGQGLGVNTGSFLALLGLLVVVLVGSQIINEISVFLSQKYRILVSIYQDKILLRKYLSISPQYLEDPDFIKEKTKLDNNLFKIWSVLDQFVDSLSGLFAGIGMLLFLLPYDWRIILFVTLSIIPNAIQKLVFGKRVWGIWGTKGDEKVIYHAYRSPLYTNDLESFQEMKVLDYGRYLLKKALSRNQKFVDALIDNETKRLRFSLVLSVFEYGLFGVAYYYMFGMLFDGVITVGGFFFVFSLVSGFRNVLRYATYAIVSIQADVDILDSLYKILHTEDKLKSGNRRLKRGELFSVEFKNVWFRYPHTEKWIFKNLCLKINPEEDLALVGENGAGKSTLIKLLLRIYDPEKGEILVNGMNLKDLDLDYYYNSVGILSQQFNIPKITAAENIILGNTKMQATQARVENAARKAQAHNFIQEYPQKYKTFFSREVAGGIMPSGGQKQRIAIARMFYREPSFLILDEPTSAIDAIAEQKIFENIQKHAKDRNVLIVSHRFSTVKHAKRIVVLDKGEIIEEGTHNELMKKKGLYEEMYIKQIG